MADEPSIEEILASLDKLLADGDIGNDDAAVSDALNEPVDSTADEDESLAIDPLFAEQDEEIPDPSSENLNDLPDAYESEAQEANFEAALNFNSGESDEGQSSGVDDPSPEQTLNAIDKPPSAEPLADDETIVPEVAADSSELSESLPKEEREYGEETEPASEAEAELPASAIDSQTDDDQTDGQAMMGLEGAEDAIHASENSDHEVAEEIHTNTTPLETPEMLTEPMQEAAPIILSADQEVPNDLPKVKADAAHHSGVVVLSEDMLIDDHQSSLPFDRSGSVNTAVNNVVNGTVAEMTKSALAEEEQLTSMPDALIAAISDRVVNQIQAALPSLIEASVQKTMKKASKRAGRKKKPAEK